MAEKESRLAELEVALCEKAKYVHEALCQFEKEKLELSREVEKFNKKFKELDLERCKIESSKAEYNRLNNEAQMKLNALENVKKSLEFQQSLLVRHELTERSNKSVSREEVKDEDLLVDVNSSRMTKRTKSNFRADEYIRNLKMKQLNTSREGLMDSFVEREKEFLREYGEDFGRSIERSKNDSSNPLNRIEQSVEMRDLRGSFA